MNMKNKLLRITEGLDPSPTLPPARSGTGTGTSSEPPAAMPRAQARTAPGALLAFRGQMNDMEVEVARLQALVDLHEGADAAKKLDPQLIDASRWANRHPDSFKSGAFSRFKAEIAEAGGNVQPILVRRKDDGRFELVFGHRRHRACLELGLPVLALVASQAIDDLQLFAAMERENRERADLTPYEQGVHYKRALEAGLYPSRRRLAEALGVSHTWVANTLLVAELPESVTGCFRSPLEIQHRHAKAIAEALDRDRKVVLRRAEKLRASAARPSAAAVASILTTGEDAKPVAESTVLKVGERVVGSIRKARDGSFAVQFPAGGLSAEGVDDALSALRSVLLQGL